MKKIYVALGLLLFMGCREQQTKSDTSKAETIEEVQLQAIKTLYPKIYEAMKKVPSCIDAAQTQNEQETCKREVKRLNKELAVSMGHIIEEEPPSGTEIMRKEEQILQLQKSIEEMHKTLTCIKDVQSMAEVQGCLGGVVDPRPRYVKS